MGQFMVCSRVVAICSLCICWATRTNFQGGRSSGSYHIHFVLADGVNRLRLCP